MAAPTNCRHRPCLRPALMNEYRVPELNVQTLGMHGYVWVFGAYCGRMRRLLWVCSTCLHATAWSLFVLQLRRTFILPQQRSSGSSAIVKASEQIWSRLRSRFRSRFRRRFRSRLPSRFRSRFRRRFRRRLRSRFWRRFRRRFRTFRRV